MRSLFRFPFAPRGSSRGRFCIAVRRARSSRLEVGPWRLLAAIVSVDALVPCCAFSAQYELDPNGSGLFSTIQDAVDFASPGDILLLGDGLYTGFGNRDIDFRGKNLILRSQSGNPENCVLDVEGDRSVPHRAFVFRSGETADARIESITMRGGRSSGAVWPTASGGAVLCTNESAPTFVDCVFEDNAADTDGGAVSCRESSPRFIGCRFLGNSAPFGGAVFVDRPCLLEAEYPVTPPPPFALEECELVANSAGDGGAVYARGLHTGLLVIDCTFRDNMADQGGALKLHGATGTFTRCLVAGNWASDVGGGFALESSIFCANGPVSGGDPLPIQMEECTLVGNSAWIGGGAYVLGYGVSLAHCTLAGNGASAGGGLYARALYEEIPAALEVDNTIIAFGPEGEAIYADEISPVTLGCSDLFGNAGGDWVDDIAEQFGFNGNLSADPLFCDPGGDNYRLLEGSPCASDPEVCGFVGAYPLGCVPAGVDAELDPPRTELWFQSTPNPFVDRLNIELTLREAGSVVLRLFDVRGREVALHDLGWLDAGTNATTWVPRIEGHIGNASDASSNGAGVFFVRAETAGRTETQKVIRVR